VSVELQLKVGSRYVTGSAVPKEFLDYGARGIRAFAYAKGMDVVNDQIRKGNKVAGFFVDGRLHTDPEKVRKNYRWEFSQGGSNMVAAIEEALTRLADLSNSYSSRSTGQIASSWAVYINGVKSTPRAAGKAQQGDDIRITSDEAYARFLESGNWTGMKSLVKRAKRAIRISEGKRVRARVNITKVVANALNRKYKALAIFDVWYEQNPFGYDFGKGQRWPAIKFEVRRNLNG
jgi:hypothetical protein